MAHEFDDDEIEQHLIEKITQAIADSGDQQNLVTKLFNPLEPEFTSLLKILEKTTNPNGVKDWMSVRRENLYQLNNLLTDWQITKSQSSFSLFEIRSSHENIKKSLKKMMKELKNEPDASSKGQPKNEPDASSKGQPDTTTTTTAAATTPTTTKDDDERSVSNHHQEPTHTLFEINKNVVYSWSSRHKPRNVYGFEHRVMAMERDLVMRNVNASYKVFGVVGVAGIGKTTLCQDIFDRKLVKQHFSPRLWVCLSKQPRDHENDYKQEVVVRMLKCLGIEDDVINAAGNGDKYGLKRLILLLRLQLIGKRYLIVLDDAWYDHKYVPKNDEKFNTNDGTNGHNTNGHDANDDDKIEDTFFLNLTQKEELDTKWGHELAYGLPKGCGGTIIASSRSQALLKKMLGKDVSLQYLKPQKDDNIEKIFDEAVSGYDEDKIDMPQYLTDLKGEILRKCDGIPLAAKLLAKIAREQLLLAQQKTTTTSAGGQVPASGNAGGGGVPKSKFNNDLPPSGSDKVA